MPSSSASGDVTARSGRFQTVPHHTFFYFKPALIETNIADFYAADRFNTPLPPFAQSAAS